MAVVPFGPRPGRGEAARRALHQEVERLAHDLKGPIGAIDEALASLSKGEGLPPGLEPEVLFAGGVPRVRPVLVVLASRAGSGSGPMPEGTADVAYVAELLQSAIRLHDLALGRQHGRRRRAARRVLGSAAHLLGAHHLTLRALEIARRAPAPEILGDALDALREVSEGQALGEALRARPATGSEAHQLAEGHTGAIFAFSCRAGGRLSGAPRPVVTGLGRYGRHVGVAVHLAEDLAVLERGDDAAHLVSRPTLYPVAIAGERDPRVNELWRQVCGTPEAKLAEALRASVRDAGGMQAAREALATEAWAARKALAGVEESPAREALD
ncbi:MAG: polyprenyl synthetase family protein, partial [Deltaproteobacteria bacterium]|nr:polyprenyl synthetase family protein [Deltaproteobacteria bacterium]